jgi:hypothetical protein
LRFCIILRFEFIINFRHGHNERETNAKIFINQSRRRRITPSSPVHCQKRVKIYIQVVFNE